MKKVKSKFYSILKILLAIILLSALFKDSFSQTTVTLEAAKDNTLYEDVGGSISNGMGKHFFAGKTLTGPIRRGLVAFNVAGSIPSCATITNVTLRLHMSRTISGDGIIELRKVLEDWGEGASAAFGEEGQGAPAEPGDATWTNTFYNKSFWSTEGGVFSNTTSASALIGGVNYYTWGSNSQMVNDVQDWLNNPSGNFGWILLGNEGANPSTKRFDTKENDSANFRPKLTVTYVMNSLTLDLTSLIEGFWNGSTMVSDTANVFLRNATSPYDKMDSSKTKLNSSGNAIFCYGNAGNGSYYIVVTHRNSIETWSKLSQSFTIGVVKNYDFTTAATQAFGDNLILKDGKYCNYSGDVNQDGIVDGSDTQLIDNDAFNFILGYVVTDVNGDEIVDGSDAVIGDNNAANFVGKITP